MVENNKKKKQHYVPQCYLNAWAIEGTHQINVYDKLSYTKRINNITDVASENYFYDINFIKALSDDEKSVLCFDDNELENLGNEQAIENFFANKIERNLSEFLREFINRGASFTGNNLEKSFITIEEKNKFSYHLSFQFIRTKSTRESIDGVSDCIRQMLEEMGVSQNVIDSVKTTKDSTKLIHGQMILDETNINRSAHRFKELIWILAINNTDTEFFTSDKPISIQPHVVDNFIPKTGLMSEGIEVFYPISPKVMLIMFDPLYHGDISNLDRHYFSINDSSTVESYNMLTSLLASRCIFSSIGDFSIIDKMLTIDGSVFNTPTVSLSWNGKVFYPRK